ncbi:pyridoxal phosphate-dependent aminotransferase, partial [Alphaproteobacteria bacterium]|nr:pyridoxal phosphate-dependent aminotransferase [Alphaproteobacteria bacterium]
NSAIFFSLICLAEKSEEILLPKPYFPTYVSCAKSLDLKINYYNLNAVDNFIPDNNEILEILKKKKIKLVIFNNPGNPTGVKYEYKTILPIIKYCQDNGIFCIFDEVYFKTVFEGKKETILHHISSLKNICILRSFSKEFFMTGFRVGYLIGDESFIQKIQLTNETINSCLPPFIQIAASQALKLNYEDKYSKFQKIIQERRDLLFSGLTNECNLECVKPNSSFYIFPKVPVSFKSDYSKYSSDLLHNHNIAVAPGVLFGDTFQNHIRMCYASVNTENLYKTIEIMKKLI